VTTYSMPCLNCKHLSCAAEWEHWHAEADRAEREYWETRDALTLCCSECNAEDA
jgi:hypothetical protein